jgi:hypothetical protein
MVIPFLQIVAVLYMTLMTEAFGATDAGKTYRCTAKDAVSLQDDGTLGKDMTTEESRKRLDGIIIDTLTGALTYPGGRREIWHVVQKGNVNKDYVLLPPYLPKAEGYVLLPPFLPKAVYPQEAAKTGATNFIRVRDWSSDPQVKFMVFELSILVTGTCEVVR